MQNYNVGKSNNYEYLGGITIGDEKIDVELANEVNK